jgi:hypothetical protein
VFALGLATAGLVATNLSHQPVFLDAPQLQQDDVVGMTLCFFQHYIAAQQHRLVDQSSGIAFPKILRIQSKAKLPDFHLVGVGARTVSFLGIRVYAVGFYADMTNPNLRVSRIALYEM